MYGKRREWAKRLPSPPTPFPRRTSRGAAARHIMEHLAAVAARWFAVFAGAPGTTDAPAPRPASPPNLPRKFTASVPLPAAVPAAVPPLASGASACGPIQQLGGPQSVVALDVSSTVSPLVRSGQPPPLALQENGTATRVRAAVPPAEQKQLLGQRLFPLVQSMEPHLAGKITGMLLEMDNGELLNLLESPYALNAKIREALSVLEMHTLKDLADLGSSLFRLPGDNHRLLLGSVARCLCTTMHTAHGGGNRVSLALRLTAVLDLLLRQAGERGPASEAMLSSLVTQLEQWAQPVEGTAASQTEMSPELAAVQLSASVAEHREAIARQLQSEDSAIAAALQRRIADRAKPRGGSGGSRWRTVVMGLVMPAAIIALSVLVHRFGHETELRRFFKG